MPFARHHFSHVDRLAYLDHASTAPMSVPVVQAVEHYLRERQFDEPNAYLRMEPVLERARSRFGKVIGADASRIGFAPNTSYALNVLAHGMDWREGDRVAVPACEFPANVMPWKGLAGRGVEVDLIRHHEGMVRLEDIERSLTPRTRVLAISWVQFLSGFRCDLGTIGELCRERGVVLTLDAIQGLGAVRLDLRDTPVDFIACGGHKWLMGMSSTGFFYVSERLQERLTPVRGWLNGPVDFDDLTRYSMDLHDDARRFRLGTLDMAGIAALDAALGLYLEVGLDEAQQQVLMLARLAADGLAALGLRRYGSSDPAHAAGIVTVEHPRADDLLEALHAAGVRASVRNGMFRMSPHWYNTPEEIDRALCVVADL